jgi:hypothetical protein
MGMIQTFRVRLMKRRRAGYRDLFGPGPGGAFSPAQTAVLADLKRFCHAETPTFDIDARVHAMREGRREVWLRIQQFLALRDDQIANIRETDDDDD